ncbi:hypothetical protein [Pseudoalteromonas sp. Of7M-16]|uniref:hypothetical protein n=1 Tax=Pseudoalteromonas sp. Of7M-16 TaxID=2917756 RepID=UPI001EF684A1|nr:hypothetical protein [Pseudoalteromonas sp. Of7M-16]MCG7548495.1 hypothetical protein [Pseudoalteromonas sp. Of7M-16]
MSDRKLSKTIHNPVQLVLVVAVFLMFVFQPLVQAKMICDHDMPIASKAVAMHDVHQSITQSHDHSSGMHHDTSMATHSDMDCCKTDCTCPTSLCAPFSLFISEANIFSTINLATDKPVSGYVGSPNQFINSVYKPPILV